MSEFTSLGDLAEMVVRNLARNKSAYFNRQADDHKRRMLLSPNPIFVRRYVEATARADDAICEVARHV